jgi:hypothetical protein
MKKTKTKTAKGTKSAGAIRASRKPVDLAAVRVGITNLVGTKALSMVQTTIEEVDKGHYGAMKYLFELIGLSNETERPAAQGSDVLAKTLLNRLDLAERPKTDGGVTKGTVAASEEIAADAVE